MKVPVTGNALWLVEVTQARRGKTTHTLDSTRHLPHKKSAQTREKESYMQTVHAEIVKWLRNKKRSPKLTWQPTCAALEIETGPDGPLPGGRRSSFKLTRRLLQLHAACAGRAGRRIIGEADVPTPPQIDRPARPAAPSVLLARVGRNVWRETPFGEP